MMLPMLIRPVVRTGRRAVSSAAEAAVGAGGTTRGDGKRLLAFGNEHMARGIGRLSEDMVLEAGQGSFVVDTEGRRFLDFTSGIGVTNTGHCHPEVLAWGGKVMGLRCKLGPQEGEVDG